MIIITETLRTDLVVFPCPLRRSCTIAVASHNAHYDSLARRVAIAKDLVSSCFLGCHLAAATWSSRCYVHLPSGGLVQNFGNIQLMPSVKFRLFENSSSSSLVADRLCQHEAFRCYLSRRCLSDLFLCLRCGWSAQAHGVFTPSLSLPSSENTTAPTHPRHCCRAWGHRAASTSALLLSYFLLTSMTWPQQPWPRYSQPRRPPKGEYPDHPHPLALGARDRCTRQDDWSPCTRPLRLGKDNRDLTTSVDERRADRRECAQAFLSPKKKEKQQTFQIVSS